MGLSKMSQNSQILFLIYTQTKRIVSFVIVYAILELFVSLEPIVTQHK